MHDCLIVSAAVIIGFLIGIMILIYPSGPVKWILRKSALAYLRNPQVREKLSRARLYPKAHFTLLEWLEATAEDPVRATYKYTRWETWFSFVMGTIWLLVTGLTQLSIEQQPFCLAKA